MPIIAFYCASCGEILLDKRVIDHVALIFDQEGADAWYAREAAQLMPEDTTCRKCGGKQFHKESNILDVWFDSGSSHLATLGRRKDLPWPSDLYIEGGDQYRGWFQSSLLVGVALHGTSPYRASITHGWTLDEQGRAMSKSKGIGIDPNDLVKEQGAEVTRLMVSSVNHVEDLRIFDELFERIREAYRKIRNTARYMLGNLSNQQDPDHSRFDPDSDGVPYDQMLEIDRWILARTARLIQRCRKGYEDYQFHQVYSALYNFCTVDLSSFYLDVLKDRLYTHATRSISRRSAQTALWQVLDAFTRLIAPILPFTAEEISHDMNEERNPQDRPVSVHVLLFPEYIVEHDREDLLAEWDRLLEVRQLASKALEEVRQAGTIGNSLEARVTLRAGATWPACCAVMPRNCAIFSSSPRSKSSMTAGVSCVSRWRAPRVRSASAAGIILSRWGRVPISPRSANAAWCTSARCSAEGTSLPRDDYDERQVYSDHVGGADT